MLLFLNINHIYGYSVYFIVHHFLQYQILLMENKHWDFSSLSFLTVYSSSICYSVNVNVCVFSHSVMSDSATSWTAACQASLSLIISWILTKFMSIELVMLSSHLIFCHPFFCLQSFPASGFYPMSLLFTSGGQSIEASTSASVLQWIFRVISFRIDCFHLLVILGTLRSLLQPHNSKHLFFSAQPSLQSNSHIYTWLLEKPVNINSTFTYYNYYKDMEAWHASVLGVSKSWTQLSDWTATSYYKNSLQK